MLRRKRRDAGEVRPALGEPLKELGPPEPRTAGWMAATSRPRVLAIDLDPSWVEEIRTAGFGVATASFGYRVLVEPKAGLFPILTTSTIHGVNVDEADVVLIDLAPAYGLLPEGAASRTKNGVGMWWSQAEQGWLDLRLPAMVETRPKFDRLIQNGTVFVVFTAEPAWELYQSGQWRAGRLDGEPTRLGEWEFLTVLKDVEREAFSGEQGGTPNQQNDLQRLIARRCRGTRFDCVFDPRSMYQRTVRPVVVGRTGHAVAAVVSERDDGGFVILLPRPAQPGGFAVELLRDALPRVAPNLYPDAKGAAWLCDAPYQGEEVTTLEGHLQELESRHREQETRAREAIEAERAKLAFERELITGSDAPLVAAVREALIQLGFSNVVDMDAQLTGPQKGEQPLRREDLQIDDGSPLLLVEVKGVAGLPKEEDALTAWKYVTPRKKRLKRQDVRGVSIVNHQRAIPPLQRVNDQVFTADVVTNAEGHDLALMTTWELLRLVRSYRALGWRHEQIRPIFLRDGVAEPIPAHYSLVGRVQRVLPQAGAISVQIEVAAIRVGDRLALDLADRFHEFDVATLEIDHSRVHETAQGQLVGVGLPAGVKAPRKGDRVFVVRDAGSTASEIDQNRC